MTSLEDFANNLPLRVLSRMTPSGGNLSKKYLCVRNEGSKDLPGACSSELFFRDTYSIRFGADDSKREIYVGISPIVETEKLERELGRPEHYSCSSKVMKDSYLKVVSKGETSAMSLSDQVVLCFKVRKKVGQDEMFEAFFYMFKPIFLVTDFT